MSCSRVLLLPVASAAFPLEDVRRPQERENQVPWCNEQAVIGGLRHPSSSMPPRQHQHRQHHQHQYAVYGSALSMHARLASAGSAVASSAPGSASDSSPNCFHSRSPIADTFSASAELAADSELSSYQYPDQSYNDRHVKPEKEEGQRQHQPHLLHQQQSALPTSVRFLLNTDDQEQASPNNSDTGLSPGQQPGQAHHQLKKKRKRRICVRDGCDKYVVDHGLCIGHGGGKRCSVDGCGCRAQNHGLCWKHGGYTICSAADCKKRAKSRGVCWNHGGGTKCKEDGCITAAVSHGLCWAHGGGRRCAVTGCQKLGYKKNGDLCLRHFSQTKQRQEQQENKGRFPLYSTVQ